MRKLLNLLIIGMTLLACNRQTPADLVIYGGPIYTSEKDKPSVEAVAVIGDSIVFTGSKVEVEKFRSDKTQILDLQGKTMTAGFIEGHGHLMGLGYNELNIDLLGDTSYLLMIDKVKNAVSKAKPGQWIIGRGWHQDKWKDKPKDLVKGFQTHELLSSVSPDNPVYLDHASGHAAFANKKAMQLAGLNQLSVETFQKDFGNGGEIVKDKLGNPTGIFIENASDIIEKMLPGNNEETDSAALELAMKVCNENGITSFQNAGYSPKEAMRQSEIINTFKKFSDTGKLTIRIYEMLSGWNRELIYQYFKNGPDIDRDHWVTVRSVKLNCDGALGSRGAWLLEPYSDYHSVVGMPTYPMDSVFTISRDALKAGFQVCSHAIGDRANQEILNRYEKAFKENPDKAKNSRFRIEHAQHLHPDDIPRFGKLGVIPAMQAIHLSSDRPWAIDRLGEKRIVDGAYVWRKLLDSGAIIVNGTDVPVEPINPIASFYASVSRKTLAGEPEGGYERDQRMTRDEALRSYTLDAAYGAFEENFKGSIKVGKLADFTVFTKDIMTIDEKELLSTEVAMTIVGGKIVYTKK